MITKLAMNEWRKDEVLTCAQALHDLLKMGVIRNGKVMNVIPFDLEHDPDEPRHAQVRLGRWWIQSYRFDSALAVAVFVSTFRKFKEHVSANGTELTVEQIEEMLR